MEHYYGQLLLKLLLTCMQEAAALFGRKLLLMASFTRVATLEWSTVMILSLETYYGTTAQQSKLVFRRLMVVIPLVLLQSLMEKSTSMSMNTLLGRHIGRAQNCTVLTQPLEKKYGLWRSMDLQDIHLGAMLLQTAT